MKNDSLSLVKLFLVLTVITGICYPLFITAYAHVCFPVKAKGDAITVNGKVVGAKMIGQKFTDAKYFQSRPSAIDYNPMPTGASNLSITTDSLKNLYLQRKNEFVKFNRLSGSAVVPSEMLFASGSGVDPHISKESAILQVDRIASVRKFGIDKRNELYRLIDRRAFQRVFGIAGEELINVLELNVQLDELSAK
jgi:potassium-transporting ATPase KdpC subunit